MDSLPMSILLIPYGLTVLFSGIFLFFNVFHMWRYGVESSGTSALIASYIALYAFVFLGTWIALAGFPWTGTFSLSDLLPSSSGVSSFGL